MHNFHTPVMQAPAPLRKFSHSLMPARAFPLVFEGKEVARAKFSVAYENPETSLIGAKPGVSLNISHFALLEKKVEVEAHPPGGFLLDRGTAKFLNSLHLAAPGMIPPGEDHFFPVSAGELRPAGCPSAVPGCPLWLGSRMIGDFDGTSFEVSSYIVNPAGIADCAKIAGMLGVEASLGFHCEGFMQGTAGVFLRYAFSSRREYRASSPLLAAIWAANQAFASILGQIRAFFPNAAGIGATRVPEASHQLAITDKGTFSLFADAPKGRVLLLEG